MTRPPPTGAPFAPGGQAEGRAIAAGETPSRRRRPAAAAGAPCWRAAAYTLAGELRLREGSGGGAGRVNDGAAGARRESWSSGAGAGRKARRRRPRRPPRRRRRRPPSGNASREALGPPARLHRRRAVVAVVVLGVVRRVLRRVPARAAPPPRRPGMITSGATSRCRRPRRAAGGGRGGGGCRDAGRRAATARPARQSRTRPRCRVWFRRRRPPPRLLGRLLDRLDSARARHRHLENPRPELAEGEHVRTHGGWPGGGARQWAAPAPRGRGGDEEHAHRRGNCVAPGDSARGAAARLPSRARLHGRGCTAAPGGGVPRQAGGPLEASGQLAKSTLNSTRSARTPVPGVGARTRTRRSRARARAPCRQSARSCRST